MRRLERRVCRRFAVPGATLRYAARRLLFLRARERNCLVLDLSPGGVRFVGMRRLPTGTRLALELVVPEDPEPVRLAGRVAWTWPQAGGGCQMGVQFEPYGEAPAANTAVTLDRILALERSSEPSAAGDDPRSTQP